MEPTEEEGCRVADPRPAVDDEEEAHSAMAYLQGMRVGRFAFLSSEALLTREVNYHMSNAELC